MEKDLQQLKKEVLDLVEYADNETFALMLDDIFGGTMIEEIDNELESWDKNTLESFIYKFSNNTDELVDEFRSNLIDDILDRYNNSEYWDPELIDMFCQNNKLTDNQKHDLIKKLGS